MREQRPLTIVTLAGDEAAMGAQHGELTRALGGFDAALDFYPGLPARMLAGGRRGLGRRLALEALRPILAAGLARLDAARPDALRARTRAYLGALGRVAAGAEARHLMAVDLAQNAIGVLARLGVVPEPEVRALAASMPGACSSFAAWGEGTADGHLLHARNFDMLGIGVWDRWPVVAFCAPRDGLRYGFLTTRGADVPGITAFNEAGLTISAHTRFHRRVRFDGLGIVDLGHLVVRRARTIADAIRIATARPVASSWALFVSSAHERSAVAIEVHAGRVSVVPAGAGRGWHTCANRFRAPEMQVGEIAPSAAWVRYSDGRQHAMERALGRGPPITPGGAKALLASREAGDVDGWRRATGDTLCQSITIQSAVFDPDGGRLWIGCGDAPASLGPWVEVPWRWGPPGSEVVAGEAARQGWRSRDCEPRQGWRSRDCEPRQGWRSRDCEPRQGWRSRDCEPPQRPSSRDREPPTQPARVEAEGWPGFTAFMEAARLEGLRAAPQAVERALARALAAAPRDPSYRHLAGGCALRAGRPDEALDHLEVALAEERSAFRRGELRVWVDRARAASRRRGRDGPDLTVDFQLLTLA